MSDDTTQDPHYCEMCMGMHEEPLICQLAQATIEAKFGISMLGESGVLEELPSGNCGDTLIGFPDGAQMWVPPEVIAEADAAAKPWEETAASARRVVFARWRYEQNIKDRP